MKKTIYLAIMAVLLSVASAQAWNLKDALKGLGGDDGKVASDLASAIGNILSTDKITIGQMQGTWVYSAPAVTFKSDNLLKKAGGAAASAAIVKKLEPIYKRTGFDKSVLTVNEDSTFVIKANRITLKGNISAVPSDKESQANFVFDFTVGGKMKIGALDAYVTKSATGSMSVMFDVSKLITLVETVGKLSGNSTLNATVSLLKSYDGLCAGFELKKSDK